MDSKSSQTLNSKGTYVLLDGSAFLKINIDNKLTGWHDENIFSSKAISIDIIMF